MFNYFSNFIRYLFISIPPHSFTYMPRGMELLLMNGQYWVKLCPQSITIPEVAPKEYRPSLGAFYR